MAHKFVQAKWFHAGGNTPVKRIVIHDMEMPEKGTTAESCAAYFARGDRQASAHFCVDSDSVVQCVRTSDIAYHAPPNTGSVGIEHAGYANQGAAGWADAFSESMLHVSATLCAELCREHDVPPVWLSIADLKAGRRGITSHNNVSKAFGRSTHTDPGPTFPTDHYIALVRAALVGAAPASTDPEGDAYMRRFVRKPERLEVYEVCAGHLEHVPSEGHLAYLLGVATAAEAQARVEIKAATDPVWDLPVLEITGAKAP